ncbi:hypothetical protein ED733_007337 [Metarhizium rileyi]|uniref:non-specific serine/threonine protein kinase n=1 Tax=Metarhizium rileyi (strain RCEF 4871) TaxID=1649241 RepID=A0A5C6GGP9_METRR|nr:hypothetical protein ED733_007337 [Metarhizium rileyi]
MTHHIRSDVIEANPIGNGLDAFRSSFHSLCDSRRLICSPRALDQLSLDDLQNLSIDLLLALQYTKASRLLCSSGNRTNLFSDISRVSSTINSGEFDFDHIKPLLKVALADSLNDTLIWHHIYNIVTETTPPPRATASSIPQTPWSQNTSSFVNSSELRQDVDRVLKQELGPLYVGVPNFCDTFFKGVPDLGTIAEMVFSKCTQGDNPLFSGRWTGWPTGAKESDVLAWFTDLVPRFIDLIPRLDTKDNYNSTLPYRRKLLAQPKIPLLGSTGKRSMDIGFVNSDITYKPNIADSKYHWSHVLVAGELKSNPTADIASIAWIDLARYAREVLAAQDTRRFVLGFTLCGSLIRVWEFDRLGGIASQQFDINKEEGGLQFVTIILGFLLMNEEMLGFDPTIITTNGQKHIKIERNGQIECLIIEEVMKHAPCIAGRATTCWKAYRKDDPRTPLVIKDSWQYTDRDEEGELLQEATKKGVINVARYYYHETVCVRGGKDDVRSGVRQALDVTKAENYQPSRLMQPLGMRVPSVSRKGCSSGGGLKRPSSDLGVALSPTKRTCSTSPTKLGMDALSNRIHRRVVLRDYGKSVYKASSQVALLAAMERCIQGHESLYNAGFLHRDISINNLMINEDEENPSWAAFLIDLDLAIRVQRESASGAKGKTGTRAFMAIGALLGQHHSFMYDLESFFWVLFWICIHYNGPGEDIGVTEYDKWNYVDMQELAKLKKGEVVNERDFLRTADENFTSYYRCLIPCINDLRKVVFPNGGRWEKEDPQLYTSMMNILREAQRDIQVLGV